MGQGVRKTRHSYHLKLRLWTRPEQEILFAPESYMDY